MIPYLGDFVEDDVVYMMFNTFSSDDPSASCTITNLANTDVHIHKDDDLTQRNNAAGITVSTNFDGITGSHMIKIDTNDNTVAGFWVTGKDYFVRVEGTTIDGATINSVVGHFSIENRFMRGTDSAALAATALTNVTWTDAKAGHIDAPISTVDTVVDGIQTDLSNAADGLGALKALIDTVDGVVDNILTDTSTTLDTLIKDIPTVAEFEARSDVAGTAATPAEVATELTTYDGPTNTEMVAAFTEIKGGTWAAGTDTLEHIRNKQTDIEGKVDTVDTVADGIQTDLSNATDGLGALKALIDTVDGVVDTILVDTNELQTDWADGGRLDLLIDGILLDTGTTLDALVKRILGLEQENIFIDNTTYAGVHMTGCRIRIYSVAGSVGGAGDVIATYTMTATYTGDEMDDYKVVKA